ncbi:UNVERIFIED_CONTAM: hypothetical protein HDU68_010555 [Siphonaria sp. JEL0065]|nr:hypothetical protein HDU68_010555 [Siphonaria sp. JEL0065]
MGTSALIRFIKIQNGQGKSYGGFRSHYDGYPQARGVQLANMLKDLCMFDNGYNSEGPYNSAHGMEDLMMQVAYHFKRFAIPGEGFVPKSSSRNKETCRDNPIMGNLSFLPTEDLDDYLDSSDWVYTVRWYVDLNLKKKSYQYIRNPTQKERYEMNNHGTITVSVSDCGAEPIGDMDFYPNFGKIDQDVATRIATFAAIVECAKRERVESYTKMVDAAHEFKLEQTFKLKFLSPEQQEAFANCPRRKFMQAYDDLDSGKISTDEFDEIRTAYWADKDKKKKENDKVKDESGLKQCRVIKKTTTTTTTTPDGTKTTAIVTTLTSVPEPKPTLEEWAETYLQQQLDEYKTWRTAYSETHEGFLEEKRVILKKAKEEHRVYYDELLMEGAEMTTDEFWDHCWAYTNASFRGEENEEGERNCKVM